jgi:hypothetical protein
VTNLRAGQENIRTFQEAARVWKFNQQLVVGLEAFAEPAELDEKNGEHSEADEHERADLQLQTFLAVTRCHFPGELVHDCITCSRRVSQIRQPGRVRIGPA